MNPIDQPTAERHQLPLKYRASYVGSLYGDNAGNIVELQLSPDGNFRAFRLLADGSLDNQALLDVTSATTKSVSRRIATIVVKANGQTYYFKFARATEQRATEVEFHGDVLGLNTPVLHKLLINNPVDPWMEQFKKLHFKITVNQTDWLLDFIFGRRWIRNIMIAIFLPLVIMIAAIIVLAAYDEHNQSQQHQQYLEAAKQLHANPDVVLKSYSDPTLKFSISYPNAFETLNMNGGQTVRFSNPGTDSAHNPNDLYEMSVTKKSAGGKTEAAYLSAAKIGADYAVFVYSDGDHNSIVSQGATTIAGHNAIKSVIHQTGINTLNNTAVDNTVTLVDIYVNSQLAYQIKLGASPSNTHYTDKFDTILQSFNLLQ